MAMTDHDFSSFGALLHTFRKRARLTQQELARVIGVHRRTLVRWEQGDTLPQSKALVLELARRLQLDNGGTRQLLEASLTVPVPYFLVPLLRNPYFTGREEILETLHAQLGVDRTVALTQSSALHGLGGVGKTQIALEYAYRHALEYSAVFWIRAETEEQIVFSFLRMAEVLQLPEREDKDVPRVVKAVQRWLSTHGQWLLIWDNVEDLGLLQRFLSSLRSGALLITTRCQALDTLARGLDLLPMEQVEGLLFLLRRAKVVKPEVTEEQMQQFAMKLPDEYAAARQIVTIMGGLPLALDQAGAYIEETGCGLAGYLLRYKQQPLHLLDRRGVVRGDHPSSVVATLRLACQRVAQQHLPAFDLLRFCAFLSPDAIPREILVSAVSHGGPVPGPLLATAFQLDSALATLRRFSLVQRHPETQMLSLHRLVQVFLREEMREQEHAEFQQRAVRLLNEAFPEITVRTSIETWETCERLLPHVMICAATIPDCRQDQEMAEVLLKAADYLHERSQYERAEYLYQRALQIQEQTSGLEHPNVASVQDRLACLYRDMGKYERAKPLFQSAVRIFEQALGPEHPQVASPLDGLALIYRKQGQYELAEPLFQRSLAIREQALGPEHLEVALSLNYLGILHMEQGQYELAELLYQRSLTIREQVLGPEHPEVARPLNNLGNLYRVQGQYELAEPLCQRAVRLFEQALGSEHPYVASMLDTLAELYYEMSRYELAELLYQRVLSIFEQALGPDHPHVAYPLHGLANLARDQSLYPEAERLYHRVLSLREQHLGPHHPEIAKTLHDLALLRQKQEHLSEAISLAERALCIRSQFLGEAHPQTMASQELYAHLVRERACAKVEAASHRRLEEIPDSGRNEHHSAGASSPLHEAATPVPSEDDSLQAFLDACCELHPRAWCRSADLWQAYTQWAEDHQERYPLSRRAFLAQLKAHGCRADRTMSSRMWRGIALVKPRA